MTKPDRQETAPSDPAVAAILGRAGSLIEEEARALNEAVREQPDLKRLADRVLAEYDEVYRHLSWSFCWPDAIGEMCDVRRRVATALGSLAIEPRKALETDDGTVEWGAATAAAYAVLGSGQAKVFGLRASQLPRLREPWERVLGTVP